MRVMGLMDAHSKLNGMSCYKYMSLVGQLHTLYPDGLNCPQLQAIPMQLAVLQPIQVTINLRRYL